MAKSVDFSLSIRNAMVSRNFRIGERLLNLATYIRFLPVSILAACLLVGLVTQNGFWSFWAVFVFGPLTLVTSWLYGLVKNYVRAKKLFRYSSFVKEAAYQLRENGFDDYDKSLLPRPDLVAQGTFIPFLAAAQQMLIYAKSLEIRGSVKAHRGRYPKELGSFREMADAVTSIATSISYQDQLSTFRKLGELFLIVLERRPHQVGSFTPGWKYTDSLEDKNIDKFVLDCMLLSETLLNGDVFSADQQCEDMINSLSMRVSGDGRQSSLAWQALIILWISVRLLGLQGRQTRPRPSFTRRFRSFLFVGPSTLLSFQIRRALKCLETGDFRGIAEQVADSFYGRHPLMFRAFPDYVVRFMRWLGGSRVQPFVA